MASKRSVLEVPGFLALSSIATVIAATVGTGIGMVVFFPMSILAILFFQKLIGAFLLAAVLAVPVTAGLFPLAAYLLRRHTLLVQFVIPAIGFAGGGAIMVVWVASGILGHWHGDREILVGIGMISGLIAGAFYGRGLHP